MMIIIIIVIMLLMLLRLLGLLRLLSLLRLLRLVIIIIISNNLNNLKTSTILTTLLILLSFFNDDNNMMIFNPNIWVGTRRGVVEAPPTSKNHKNRLFTENQIFFRLFLFPNDQFLLDETMLFWPIVLSFIRRSFFLTDLLGVLLTLPNLP